MTEVNVIKAGMSEQKEKRNKKRGEELTQNRKVVNLKEGGRRRRENGERRK